MRTSAQRPGDSAISDGVVKAIRTVGLTKRFGSTTALNDLDLEVSEGEVLEIAAPERFVFTRRDGAAQHGSRRIVGREGHHFVLDTLSSNR